MLMERLRSSLIAGHGTEYASFVSDVPIRYPFKSYRRTRRMVVKKFVLDGKVEQLKLVKMKISS